MRHLLDIRTLSIDEVNQIMERATFFKQNSARQLSPVPHTYVANLFFEPSTRTRFSFEVAERRLGAEILNFSEASSSRVKGETVYDTVRTLEAIGANVAVIRVGDNMLLHELQDSVNLSLINAGAGNREHPTQALLDLFTIQEQFGRIDGLTVGIVGDIKHSRVAGSHMHLLPRMGAKLMFAGAEEMLERPNDPIPDGVALSTIDEIVAQADVVMMLRIQHERHARLMNIGVLEYHQEYGLTVERAKRMKPSSVIMHPAPINRGVEIDTSLVEADNSLIFNQVTNGVYTRMAVLEMVLRGNKNAYVLDSGRTSTELYYS